ncbi:thiol peroxidase [Peribacillus muralis]|uniref:thiol peroxidase n=1 Tax=Peribacillus muralis TaxID=264697 RepID=UPI001F4DACB5|nr:thiol peroxidase [Peribacillus muralis]MCK1993942.1 thiol peroxidase [Peribacillus muralis]MCK2014497.1 thiol peroxidase [Peribacillus muralis]
MAYERTDAVTLGGNPVTLIGPELRVGDKAPDFAVLTNDRRKAQLTDYENKTCIITTVPSLDTGVCDLQTKLLNEEASNMGEDVAVLTISVDLPFAQARWCKESNVDAITILSDHVDLSFGTAYGTYMKEHRLECRAVFVINQEGIIEYVEYVSEVTDHPDYESALQVVKKLINKAGTAK